MDNYEDRLIARAQRTVRDAGYRWEERTFVDGHYADTMLRISQDEGHSPLLHVDRTMGWGRFSRIECWEQAEDFVKTFGTVEAYREAGSPSRTYYWQRWADVLPPLDKEG